MLTKFGTLISARLLEIGITSLSKQVVTKICRTVHTASLITEEGRFVQGSITLADPHAPENPPKLRRAHYPAFTSLKKPSALTPEFFAKLARAVDQWSGSIAAWGTSPAQIFAWGIVDQLVGMNTYLNREDEVGFTKPGLLTIVIDRPGDLTAYHGNLFLGALRAQKIIRYESEPFRSSIILKKLNSTLSPISIAICNAVKAQVSADDLEVGMLDRLINSWESTIARICIGLRRMGTGGALIITPSPLLDLLSIGREFEYERLAASLALELLDSNYLAALEDQSVDIHAETVSVLSVLELDFARADAVDRKNELRGAVKLVTSLAAMDGALLLSPDLRLMGFGVKTASGTDSIHVYEGDDFENRGTKAKKVDLSLFGTRHASMLRYCRIDTNAIGVVVSQDGHVRVMTTHEGNLIMWDRIQLLRHQNFTSETVKRYARKNKRNRTRNSSGDLGYSPMPKTLKELKIGKSV